jgi:uncharacterized surface protein with fasciclin (FAS1) repeats
MKRSLVIGISMVLGLVAACGGTADTTSTTAAPINTTTAMTTELADIVETAQAAGEFTILLTAVEAAGLVDTLKGEGPFTVFAPTDEAFAALPEGTLEALLADTDTLTQILLYHVVAGQVTVDQVVELESAETVEGSTVTIRVEDGKVFINDAEVITTDILTSNGVIHVIDAVILPA